MITLALVLLLGVLLGALVAYPIFLSGASAHSRRALTQLQDTLEGLESAYRIEVATLDARREMAGLPRLPAAQAALTLHLPRSDA